MAAQLRLAQVAARAGVSPATVRRWVKEGLIPQYDGGWTPAAAAQVRIVARLRERGYTVEQIREASASGRLALGDVEQELPGAVVNVHFEEQVSGDTMTFDYRLRSGIVHSSNALRIMRMVGIDVVDVLDVPG